MREYKWYRNVVVVRTALGWTASVITNLNGPNRMPSRLPSDQEILEVERKMHEQYGRYGMTSSESNPDEHHVHFTKVGKSDVKKTPVELSQMADKLRVDEPTEVYNGSGIAQQKDALINQ